MVGRTDLQVHWVLHVGVGHQLQSCREGHLVHLVEVGLLLLVGLLHMGVLLLRREEGLHKEDVDLLGILDTSLGLGVGVLLVQLVALEGGQLLLHSSRVQTLTKYFFLKLKTIIFTL